MLHIDKSAVVCDLAETYQIYNYRELSPAYVATLCIGLRDNSRIKMKLSGIKAPLNTILLAGIFDIQRQLLWAKTKDGQKGINPPELLVPNLLEEKKRDDIITFEKGSDFDMYRRRLIERSKHGSR